MTFTLKMKEFFDLIIINNFLNSYIFSGCDSKSLYVVDNNSNPINNAKIKIVSRTILERKPIIIVLKQNLE